jgi:hypothetical protein
MVDGNVKLVCAYRRVGSRCLRCGLGVSETQCTHYFKRSEGDVDDAQKNGYLQGPQVGADKTEEKQDHWVSMRMRL